MKLGSKKQFHKSEAGPVGGEITADGTPEQVSKSKVFRTAPFLR